MALPLGIWSTRDASDLISATEGEERLQRSIGPVGLTAMGVGAIIGTGIFAIIGVLLCLYLMTDLPGTTWIRFVVWLVVGMVIYVAYGYKHSRLRTKDKKESPA